MKDVMKKIETTTETYPFVLNLNVIDLIQEKYENLDAWADKIEGTVRDKNGKEIDKVLPSIKDLKWFFKEAINEGIDIENEENENKRSFITEKQAGRIITEMGIEWASKNIQEITEESILTNKQKEEQKNV